VLYRFNLPAKTSKALLFDTAQNLNVAPLVQSTSGQELAANESALSFEVCDGLPEVLMRYRIAIREVARNEWTSCAGKATHEIIQGFLDGTKKRDGNLSRYRNSDGIAKPADIFHR